jgi:3-oxoacyl-[acyl-carrier-protein] synthase II
VGVVAPNGIGKDSFWTSLVHGQTGIGPITLFDTEGSPCKIAGEIRDFDPAKFIAPQLKPKRMGRFTQLALVATDMAIEDSGLELEALRRIPRLPLFMGVGSSAVDILEEHAHRVRTLGQDKGVPYSTFAFMPHSAAATISSVLRLNTEPVTISTACAAGLDSVGLAFAAVRSGRCDLAIAGGADAPITQLCFASFAAARLVPTEALDPRKASRPFDLGRTSGVISEGAGVVILENLDHARARNHEAYLELNGYGMSMDPSLDDHYGGMAEAIRMALANAGKRPCDVDFICAHGPGHPVMDRIETGILKEVFGAHAYSIPVSSIKGNTGNPLAAAGVHQVVATSLAFRHGLIPPTANLERPDPDCDLDIVTGAPRLARLHCALINTHGLGGRNGSLVVGRVKES